MSPILSPIGILIFYSVKIISLTLVTKQHWRKLKGLRKGYEGSQDWDLTLRFTEQIKKTCILMFPKYFIIGGL